MGLLYYTHKEIVTNHNEYKEERRMNIFQMKTKPHGIERFRQFVDEKFVCIGWPGIGNLENVSKDEIRSRIRQKYNYQGHKLGNALGQVNTFVNTMKSGGILRLLPKKTGFI